MSCGGVRMRRGLGLGQLDDDEVGLRTVRQRGGEVIVEWGSKFFFLSLPVVQVVGSCGV